MTTSDKVAAVLTAGAVVSGTVGGFLVDALGAAVTGFFVLSGYLFTLGVLIGLTTTATGEAP